MNQSHSEDSIQETGFQDGVSQEQLNLYSDLEDSIQETSFQYGIYINTSFSRQRTLHSIQVLYFSQQKGTWNPPRTAEGVQRNSSLD